MKSESRILIKEAVVKDEGASFSAGYADMGMMLFAGALERTEFQWCNLISSVDPGLEIVKIWGLRGGYLEHQVIEVKLA